MVSPDGSDPNVFAARADEHVEDTDHVRRVTMSELLQSRLRARAAVSVCIFYRSELRETVGATPAGSEQRPATIAEILARRDDYRT